MRNKFFVVKIGTNDVIYCANSYASIQKFIEENIVEDVELIRYDENDLGKRERLCGSIKKSAYEEVAV